jgi:hypothetical protein
MLQQQQLQCNTKGYSSDSPPPPHPHLYHHHNYLINMNLYMFSLLHPFHHQVPLMLQHDFQNENNLFPNGKQVWNKWHHHEEILPTQLNKLPNFTLTS